MGHQGWLCASPMFKVTQGAQGRGGNRTPATLMPGQHRCHCMGEIFPTICAAFLETGESLLAPLCLPGTDFFFFPCSHFSWSQYRAAWLCVPPGLCTGIPEDLGVVLEMGCICFFVPPREGQGLSAACEAPAAAPAHHFSGMRPVEWGPEAALPVLHP